MEAWLASHSASSADAPDDMTNIPSRTLLRSQLIDALANPFTLLKELISIP
ncbi:hypothetical protein JCM19239_5854 [Vibrio variabilis]|uniref:Uncharacterized protein n=1 Tax=Vibrio variabilis TaxID=990271 RepID=A0ABQ0J8I7_9VIBR|nr:hypothetical protein JCM19239_5854 [Vibrio variabilis]